jgi:DNA-binding transcriptional LysR family regulator
VIDEQPPLDARRTPPGSALTFSALSPTQWKIAEFTAWPGPQLVYATDGEGTLVIRPDFTTLRLFLSVYNSGNISKASEREHIAPSAISKRIQAFEAQLNTQLFYRNARGVVPTPAGKALAAHAQQLFESLNRVAAELSSYSDGARGEVRIHAHSSAVIQYLPEQLGDFVSKYPEVHILLREETSLEVLQSMMDGVVDIGVIDGNVPQPVGIRTLPYVRDRLIALVPRKHPLAARRNIAFNDIRDSDHVSLEPGVSLQVLVSRAAETNGFQLKTRIEVKTMEAATRMVEAGLGIAILPEKVVRYRADNSTVRIVGLTDEWAIRELVLCVKDQQPLTASAQLMLGHLKAPATCPRAAAREMDMSLANTE